MRNRPRYSKRPVSRSRAEGRRPGSAVAEVWGVVRAAGSIGMLDPEATRVIYDRLLARYGPQGWWPADEPFEIMVGAVLTQNTAWSNVERAIKNLRAAGLLDPESILAEPPARLASYLKPSGYFNVKADRLRHLCRFVVEAGGLDGFRDEVTARLRERLLAVKGIGPETADDILLYAFERPVFVVDAYTRRLLRRTGLHAARVGYEPLRAAFERALPADVALYQEFHGLIVRHAKVHCKKRPHCDGCPVRDRCAYEFDAPSE